MVAHTRHCLNGAVLQGSLLRLEMLAEPCRIDRIRQSGTQFAVLTVLAAFDHVAHMHTIATVVLSLLRSGPFQKATWPAIVDYMKQTYCNKNMRIHSLQHFQKWLQN